MLRCIGKIPVLDSGAFSWGSRVITKFIDNGLLVQLLMVRAYSQARDVAHV